MWKENLSPLITKLPDGSSRFTCIDINCEPRPVCLISTYMPTQGAVNSTNDYKNCLDELHEIIEKYRCTHSIILAGDMNASTKRNKTCDVLFQKFIYEHNLKGCENLDDRMTFHHNNGRSCSQIDYILYSCDIEQPDEVTVIESGINISSHHAIACVFKGFYFNEKLSINNNKSNIVTRRFQWKKGDPDRFNEHLGKFLRNDRSKLQQCDVNEQVKFFNESIIKASEETIPIKNINSNKKKKPVSRATVEVLRKSQNAYGLWKEAGKPNAPHPLYTTKQELKHEVQRVLRVERAENRQKFYNEVMENSNNSLFHRLINKQRKNKNRCSLAIMVDDRFVFDPVEQTEAWACHFESLSSPNENSNLNQSETCNAKSQVENIKFICQSTVFSTSEITEIEVRNAIHKLNTAKSPDVHGITTEHLKYACDTIVPYLTDLFNEIRESKTVPDDFKFGLMSTFPKKNKDVKVRGNYRGITITGTIGKVLEHVYNERLKPIISKVQSELQFGFTEGLSPMFAALIISESMIYAKEHDSVLYIALLDATKAFDVVSHEILFKKLYLNEVDPETWLLINDWYSNLESAVKWKGNLSRTFDVKQGVRQGGVLSTGFYKLFVNDLLLDLENTNSGLNIGELYLGCPTVADDVSLLSLSECELQTMLDKVYNYANDHCYGLNATKSLILMYGNSSRLDSAKSLKQWTLGNEPLPVVKEATHVGVLRNTDKPDLMIDDRIQSARRTAYSLMGAGFHGINGVSPTVCMAMYKCYVLPILLYGLEIMNISSKSLEKLSKFHLYILKAIQTSSKYTSTAAIYLTIGALPVTAYIHKRALTLLGCIMRSQNRRIRDWSLYMAGNCSFKSSSWFTFVCKLLKQYGLPELCDIHSNPMPKLAWKSLVSKQVNTFWNAQLMSEVQIRSTLIFLEIPKYGKPHQVWLSVNNNAKDVQRAHVKYKLLTGTYLVNQKKAKFSGKPTDSICTLCNSEDETIVHFLLKCSALSQPRSVIMDLVNYLKTVLPINEVKKILSDDSLLTQLIIDCSKLLSLPNRHLHNIELITRKLCFNLHCRRRYLLEKICNNAQMKSSIVKAANWLGAEDQQIKGIYQ